MSDRSSPHQVNLLDFIAFLLRWRRFLTVLVFSAAAMAAVVSLVVKPRYRSVAVIRGIEGGSQGIGSLIATKLAALGGIGGFAPIMGEVPGEVFVQILKSRWMSERLIDEFDLRTVYKMADEPVEQLIDMVKSRTRYELEIRSQTVQLYVDDEDPKLAQSMAQFLVDELDRRNQELKSSRAKREREFVGQRLTEARTKLGALEDSLTRFQLETGVFDVDEQVKATISAAAVLEAQKLALQTELELNRQLLDSQSPEIAFLRIKLASIDSSLQALASKRTGKRDVDFLLHLRETPEYGLTYVRLMRDIEIQQLLVGYLIQQDEQARLDEQRNTPTLLRLDPPAIATERIWPKRSLMVLTAALGALMLGLIIALAIEFIGSAARNPDHPQHARILSIRQSWTKR